MILIKIGFMICVLVGIGSPSNIKSVGNVQFQQNFLKRIKMETEIAFLKVMIKDLENHIEIIKKRIKKLTDLKAKHKNI